MEILLLVLLGASVALCLYLYVSNRAQKAALECQIEQFDVERESLQETYDKELQNLLDGFGEAILIIGKSHRVELLNEAAAELFAGRSLLGVALEEVLPGDKFGKLVRSCVETRERQDCRIKVPVHSNMLVGASESQGAVLSVHVSPSQFNRSLQGGVSVVIRDMTQEVEAEKVRRDFVANASHELRTPMAIIQGYLENLMDDGALDDEEMTRRFLGIMQKHSRRILCIVEDMLAISRLESVTEMPLNAEAFHFLSCVNDVEERLSSMISEGGVTFNSEVNPADLEMVGDRFYWTQILFNLVENAMKQNTRKEGLQVTVKTELEGEMVTIEVVDNGKGIPAADVPFVFLRFYRVDKHHTNSAVKGTGLGLSIVRRAVEAHGGTISLESRPGVETRFVMRVPRMEVGAQAEL